MKKLEPGMVFGTYNVIRKLGEGGMGEVWLLRSQTDDTPVAGKFLDPEESADHEARRRFVREAELAMNIRHENLVTVYDVGEDPDTELCYILMEYVPGGTLADYLRRKGALSVDDAISVVHAIARVLELARRSGIVHRDIKPANIMFAADGTPKLADLGIARTRAGGNTTTVTQTGIMIGTPAYMAPEQMLDSHSVDIRADIYSLGIVFYEMLAGSRPFADSSVVQLMAKAVAKEPIPDIRKRRPEVKATVAEMVNFMCAPEAENRISSPQRIVEWCEKILSGQRVLVVPRRKTALGASSSESRRQQILARRTRTTLVLGVVFVVIAFGFGFLSSMLMNDRRSSIKSVAPGGAFSAAMGTASPSSASPVDALPQPINIKLEPEPETKTQERQVDASKLQDYSSTLAVQKTLNELFTGWKTSPNRERHQDDPGRYEGYVAEFLGRKHCVCTHPVSRDLSTVTLTRLTQLPDQNPVLRFSVAAHFADAEFRLTVKVQDSIVWEGDVAGGKWEDFTVDLSNWAGMEVKIELIQRSTGWYYEWAYWSRLEVDEWNGTEKRVFRPHPVEPLLDYYLFKSEDPTLAVQRTVNRLFPGWEVSENGKAGCVGYQEEFLHRHNVLMTHPPREGVPVVLSRSVELPLGSPELQLEVASAPKGDFEIEVLVDGRLACREPVEAKDGYKRIRVPLGDWAGKSVRMEIRQQPTGWQSEHAFWSKIQIVSVNDQENGRGRADETAVQ